MSKSKNLKSIEEAVQQGKHNAIMRRIAIANRRDAPEDGKKKSASGFIKQSSTGSGAIVYVSSPFKKPLSSENVIKVSESHKVDEKKVKKNHKVDKKLARQIDDAFFTLVKMMKQTKSLRERLASCDVTQANAHALARFGWFAPHPESGEHNALALLNAFEGARKNPARWELLRAYAEAKQAANATLRAEVKARRDAKQAAKAKLRRQS